MFRTRLASLFLFAAAAVVYGTARETMPPPPAPAAVAPRCRFEAGDTAAFAIESSARAFVDGQPYPERDEARAVLSWRARSAAADGSWTLDAALTDVVLDQTLSRPEEQVREPLDAGFTITLDPRCRMTAFAFDPSWTPRARQLVLTLLKTYEVVTPEVAAHTWRADQQDGVGAYVARYHRGAADRVVRTKIAYEVPSSAEGIRVAIAIRSSEALATLDGRGRWLSAVEGRERVAIAVNGETQADLEQTFRLVRDDTRFVAPTPSPRLDATDPFAMEVSGPDDLAEAFEGSSGEALDRFAAMFAGGDESRSYEASQRLAARLRAEPGLANVVLEALRAGRFEDHERAAIYLALELSGTPETAAVLETIIGERSFASIDRARAASALSDHGAPTLEKTRVLAGLADDESSMVAAVGTLALGNLGARAESNAPEVYETVRRTLADALGAAEQLDRELLVLDAIGNLQDESFAADLATRLSDPRDAMRTHAAEALAGLDREVAEPALLAQLRDEADSRVTATLARALQTVGARSAAALELARDRLSAETSANTRASLVDWLGASGEQAALVEQFHRERDVEVQRRIGRYVSAEALR